MKIKIIYIIPLLLLLIQSCFKIPDNTTTISKISTFCNPLNLNYRFCADKPSRREAADPVMILYKNEYYLFASKAFAYWHSTDMINWDLISSTDLPLEDYAPAVVVVKDTLYFMASNPNSPPKIYKTTDPKSGKWSVANSSFPISMIDPDLFLDDDGRLYFYYGCSDVNPIYGVELDKKTLNPIGKSLELFNSNKKNNGWERFGDYNDKEDSPWVEGPWMTKYGNKYYLQYAVPGTQFKSYCDGVYVSDKPLGPFTPAANNPVSYKPEGFIAGAGHSNTFQDKYGNYWHTSTMTVSIKHIFERRIGLFPVFFDNDGEMYTYTTFGDFPMKMPKKKISSPAELFPKWMLLSYNKPVEVSSELPNHSRKFAADEEIRSYWSAATGNKGEWLLMDLKTNAEVNAIQINYAENQTEIYGRNDSIYHQYLLQYSLDGKNWKTLADKTENKSDVPHDYIELAIPTKARYIKMINYKVPGGTFAIAGLRVFGNANGTPPQEVKNLNIQRSKTDPCIVDLKWNKSPDAVGYNIRYGTSRDKLYLNYQVFDSNSLTIRSLNSKHSYYFTIDTFNESGVTVGTEIIEVK